MAVVQGGGLGRAPALSASFLLLLVSSLMLWSSRVQAEINTLDLDEDGRTAFSIETFSFVEGGHIDVQVHNYSLYVDDKPAADIQWGIMLRGVMSKSDGPAKLAVEATRVLDSCSLAAAQAANPELVLMLSDTAANAPNADTTDANTVGGAAQRQLHWGFGEDHEHEINSISFSHNFTSAAAGRYDIEMIVCLPSSQRSAAVELSAVVRTTCYNVNSDGSANYLAAGETSLPALYVCLAVAFLLAVAAWVYVLLTRGHNVLLLHYIMLVLILFKVTALGAFAVHLFFVSRLGQTLSVVGWDVVYFAFSFLNGGAMFVLILLVGSGWSYIKPKLSGRENNMLTAVVLLQVVANVARIFVGESSPGSLGFVRWSDILAVVDVVCCALVIFPIIWSIHKLKNNLAEVEAAERAAVLDDEEAAAAAATAAKHEGQEDPDAGAAEAVQGGHAVGGGGPGELAHSLMKLRQFRHFYIVVVCYIYFTRIVVYFVDSTLPFTLAWVAPLAQELATLAFYVLSGYYFVPAPDNPYLQVADALPGDDGDDGEAEEGDDLERK